MSRGWNLEFKFSFFPIKLFWNFRFLKWLWPPLKSLFSWTWKFSQSIDLNYFDDLKYTYDASISDDFSPDVDFCLSMNGDICYVSFSYWTLLTRFCPLAFANAPVKTYLFKMGFLVFSHEKSGTKTVLY